MESKDFEDFVCPFVAVRETNRAIAQLYELVMAPSGLKASQFAILYAIGRAGEIAQCDFARHYSISVETLSRRFGVLRRKGLVAARVGPHSERIYSLTKEGKEAINRAFPYWQNAQRRLRQALGESEWSTFLRACTEATSAARRAEGLRTRNGEREHTVDPIRNVVTIAQRQTA